MRIVTYDDIGQFAALVRPLLLADEKANVLPLGILSQMSAGREDREPSAIVGVDGQRCGIVLRASSGAPTVLAHLAGVDPSVLGDAVGRFLASKAPGGGAVTGPEPAIEATATTWAAELGGVAEIGFRMRRMVCTEVSEPRPVAGAPRRPEPEEAGLVASWLDAFRTEALSHPSRPADGDDEQVRRRRVERIRSELEHGTSPYWWWEVDSEPVCLLGIGSPTGSGERVAPVYTLPEHRRRGYAGALVAHATADALRRGCAFVGLYTDADDPASNRAYARVGYVDIGNAAQWKVSAP